MSSAPSEDLSCFLGEVRHRRLRPVEHQFTYRSFFFRINAGLLDPLLSSEALRSAPSLSQTVTQNEGHRSSTPLKGPSQKASLVFGCALFPLFGINRRAFISMHAKDHGSLSSELPLSAWLLGLLSEHQLPRPAKISLVAYPRVFGYQFKPVSFWHCEDEQGKCLAIVAEVHNTFSGRHAYLLSPKSVLAGEAKTLKNGQTLQTEKRFVVSPFCTISGSYRFRFFNDEIHSLSRIEYVDDQGLLLITSLRGERISLSSRTLIKLTLAIPWQSLLVVLRIHWQALKLWLKKVPFYGAQQTPPPPQSLPSQGT